MTKLSISSLLLTTCLATMSLVFKDAYGSLVVVMDSGTDISHKDLSSFVWKNRNEFLGSQKDNDGSGLPGDVYGWDFTSGSPRVFDGQYSYLITPEIKKFYSLVAKNDLGLATDSELSWLKNAVKNSAFMEKVNFVGSYSHGTHVSGLSVKGNPKASLMSIKMIATSYKEGNNRVVSNSAPPIIVKKTFDEFKVDLTRSAEEEIQSIIEIHKYLNFYRPDVVNQSFGISAQSIAKRIINTSSVLLGKKLTKQEVMQLLVQYFKTIKSLHHLVYSAAPQTLFVVAAGNDAANIDELPDFPSDVNAENKITVAATLGNKGLAPFSNYGAMKVDVAAPGVAILSQAPSQSYVHMSGTSQAAPYVTNIASLIKDINPALKVRDIKDIIIKTVDVKDWLRGKVKTSGFVNKERALRAAELSKSLNIENAINKSHAIVPDQAIVKSFVKPAIDIGIKPIRPSLILTE